jgi:hypothetical protein
MLRWLFADRDEAGFAVAEFGGEEYKEAVVELVARPDKDGRNDNLELLTSSPRSTIGAQYEPGPRHRK